MARADMRCSVGYWAGFCGGIILHSFCRASTAGYIDYDKPVEEGIADIKNLIDSVVQAEGHRWSTLIAADRAGGALACVFQAADATPTIRHKRRVYAITITPPAINPNSGNICRTLTITKSPK